MNYLNVVPYVGTWIEISSPVPTFRKACGRSLRGNVDRNASTEAVTLMFGGRSLRGNVDRNVYFVRSVAIISVVPYVGTWIEILYQR